MVFTSPPTCKSPHFCSPCILSIPTFSAMNIHSSAGGFVIAAGAILGICAGLLWTAQGSLILSYPTEIQKGRFISIFWAIFNLGAVIGSAVSLGLNFHSSVGLFLLCVLNSMLTLLVKANSGMVCYRGCSRLTIWNCSSQQ